MGVGSLGLGEALLEKHRDKTCDFPAGTYKLWQVSRVWGPVLMSDQGTSLNSSSRGSGKEGTLAIWDHLVLGGSVPAPTLVDAGRETIIEVPGGDFVKPACSGSSSAALLRACAFHPAWFIQ